jgi:hypothetical protein
MTLAEFRASMTLVTPTQYENVYGKGIMDAAQQGDMVRCYDSGAWILYRAATGDHWMHLEAEEYETAGDYDLQDMEETLYRWTHPTDQTNAATDSAPADPLPGENADSDDYHEWAGRNIGSRKQNARLAAILLMTLCDPEGRRPHRDDILNMAREMGSDYTASLLMLAGEIHKHA